MKILEHGNVRAKRSCRNKKLACNRCDCKFSFGRSDEAKKVFNPTTAGLQGWPGELYVYFVDCPQCYASVIV